MPLTAAIITANDVLLCRVIFIAKLGTTVKNCV